MLVDGGFCHWHLRKNGQVTIREIISTKKGAGSKMLRRLKYVQGATSLFAKCPVELESNQWYQRQGFVSEGTEQTKSGHVLNLWRLSLAPKPTVKDLEIIFCAGGNPRFAQIAIDSGMEWGAQLPSTIRFKPYFVDQDWRNPDRKVYMNLLAQYQPYMATVLDLEREDQLQEVLDWAQEASEYVQRIIIIPKVNGIIKKLPSEINGKPVRLGYSVPTRYAGTTVPLDEFKEWDSVHLLGGPPEKQMKLYKELGNVKSVDSNYMQKMALRFNCYWAYPKWIKGSCRVAQWPTLKEAGTFTKHDAPYVAFERSCVNIMQAWNDLLT
jgi:hypothetical protein